MKYLQRLLALFAISAVIFSCQKEYSIEKSLGGTNPDAQWEFKEGGVQFKGPIDTATIDTLSPVYKLLTIDGHSDDGTGKVTLQLFGPEIKIGTYKTPFSLFAYSKGGTILYQTDQTAADSFTIVISKIDSNGVSGTFTGKALLATSSTTKSIVDGKFSAVFKSGIVTPPVSTDSGQVVLWSKAGCGGGTSTNPITVKVAGKTGQLTSFSATEPTTCDPAGSFNLKLPVGSYPWVAICGTDSITGTLTVTKGACTKTQVDFSAPVTGDYYPLTKNSNWSMLYQGGAASDTVYTFNPGTVKTLLGNIYTLQTNDYGPVYGKDSVYNRKSGNSYYQYVAATNFADTSSGTIILYQIPAYEFRFLVDNLSANATFSDSVKGSITLVATGVVVPVTFTFKSTITAKGVTATVAGTTYQNVIKVKTITSDNLGGAVRNTEVTEYWYALNVGVIKFLDYYTDPTFTTPDDVWNLTRYKVF